MPPEFVDTVARSLWNRQSWDDLFESPKRLSDVFDGGEFTRTAEVDFDSWVQEKRNSGESPFGALWALQQRVESFIELGSKNASRRCQDCGSAAQFVIYAPEQELDGFYCRSCVSEPVSGTE